MRGNELLDKMELVDPAYVEAANGAPKKKKNIFIQLGAVAACLLTVVVVGILTTGKSNSSQVPFSQLKRNYKDLTVVGSEFGVEWPWEYKTISEQYTRVTLNGKEYSSKGRSVDASLIGDSLGTFPAVGYDIVNEQEHQITTEVYRIAGVSSDHLIAVKLGDEYYVFKNNEYAPSANFGELFDDYSLTQTLSLTTFALYENRTEKGYFTLRDDKYIFDVLSTCRDAEFIKDDNWHVSDKDYIVFSVTSEALGVYKNVFYVTADGYIRTNIFDYAYIFRIGEEAAEDIISYAKKNGVETEAEPYAYTLAGTITDIADGYIYLDDSIMCVDENDGMVFKIPMDDIRISRCIDYAKMGVGDVVLVYYSGNVDVDAGNVVIDAYALSKAYVTDGGIAIPE
jgi:hypothetical protein